MLLQIKHINTAYPLEQDISRLTRTDPPKRWLVFMEIRVKRCITLETYRHWFPNDLFSFMSCLAFGYKPQVRCIRSVKKIGRWRIKATVSSSRILLSGEVKRNRHCPIRTQSYRLLVHKLFGFNLTMDEFTALDSSRVLPLPGQCTRASVQMIVFCNNGSIIYCGKRNPWSIFSNTNKATVELVFTGMWVTYDITISMNMWVVDRFYSTNQQPSRTAGSSAWGFFKIITYCIAVEMIYKVRVLIILDSQEALKINFYDGPDAKMPRLPAFRKLDNQTVYISSTFQVFYVYAFNRSNSLATLYYTAEYSFPRYLTTDNTEVILKNDTPCSNNTMKSWMCTFHIVSPYHKHAQVRITSLNITGVFASVHAFVGVAIYNVVNNKTSLVGHWCYSKSIRDTLTVTGSENQLIITFYAYSPYSYLSCIFSTFASRCAGSFIGKHIRPSVATMTRYISCKQVTHITNGDLFDCTYDVSNHCHAIHASFLPTEYTMKEPSIRIHFKHEKIIRLIRNIVAMSAGTISQLYKVTVSGIYTRSYLHVGHELNLMRTDFEITGDIKYVHMDVLPIYGNIPITIFTVFPIACIQPCSELNPILPNAVDSLYTCNMCKHGWLDSTYSHKTIYETNPHASVIFERVYGFGRIIISVTPFVNYKCQANELITYYSYGLSLRFMLGSVFSVMTSTGEYWRYDISEVVKVRDYYDRGDCSPVATPTRVRIWGINLYTLVSEFQVRGSSWQQWYDHCAKYGADMLTVDDQNELFHFVENIMLPFAISITTIGIMHQVRF